MSAPRPTAETIRFPVTGMTCGSCVNRIMRAVAVAGYTADLDAAEILPQGSDRSFLDRLLGRS